MLTPREREILVWLAKGKRTTDVADILEINPRTVARHLASAYTKLGCENRLAALVRAGIFVIREDAHESYVCRHCGNTGHSRTAG